MNCAAVHGPQKQTFFLFLLSIFNCILFYIISNMTSIILSNLC